MTESAPYVCPECAGKRYHRRGCSLSEGSKGNGLLAPFTAVAILRGYVSRIEALDDPRDHDALAHARLRLETLTAGL